MRNKSVSRRKCVARNNQVGARWRRNLKLTFKLRDLWKESHKPKKPNVASLVDNRFNTALNDTIYCLVEISYHFNVQHAKNIATCASRISVQ